MSKKYPMLKKVRKNVLDPSLYPDPHQKILHPSFSEIRYIVFVLTNQQTHVQKDMGENITSVEVLIGILA